MNNKLISFIKLLCVVYLVIFLPKIISDKCKNYKSINPDQTEYLSSMDNLIKNKDAFYWIKKLNLALILNTNTNLQEEKINHLIKDGFKIKKIFVFNNNKNAKNIQFKKIKAPVYLFHKLNKEEFSDIFKGINGIIFNVQGLGTRNDQAFKVLMKTMINLQKTKINLIILDKPNPIAKNIEGPGNIPFQHGLTTAELAKYFNNYILKKPIKLTIIPMAGWQRNENMETSKNIYTINLLKLLNKINPINNEGDGCLICNSMLLPNKSLSKWEKKYFKNMCNNLGLNCEYFSFFSKTKQKKLKGIKISPMEGIKTFSSFNAMLTITRFLNNRKNLKLEYSDSFNKMLGSKDTKEFLQNNISFKQLKSNTEKSLKKFYTQASRIFLYTPYPQIGGIKLIKVNKSV